MSWFCLEKGQFLAHFCDTKRLRNSTKRNERELSWTSFPISLAIASGFVNRARANRFRLCNIPFVNRLGAQMLRKGDACAARTVKASAQASPA